MRSWVIALAICASVNALALYAQGGRTREWLTWGGDQERTGWNRGETALSKQNVARLALKWKAQIDKDVSIEIESGNSMLTAPLVAQNVRTPGGARTVVYTLSAANTLVALDAATGSPIWQRTVDRTVQPSSEANWICTNMSTVTPVIDKAASTIYMISADGRLHGLDMSTGEGKLIPSAGIRHAVFTQLEPQSHRRCALHDRRPRMRQRTCPGSTSPSARNDSRRRHAATR